LSAPELRRAAEGAVSLVGWSNQQFFTPRGG